MIHKQALALVFATTAASWAQAQSAEVPLNPPALAAAPQSGALSNGVTWSVDIGGPWTEITGVVAGGIPYAHYLIDQGGRQGGVQTWTFSEAVDIEFSVAGLNCLGEGLRLPAGTQAVTVSPDHTWDATALTVTRAGPASQAAGASTSTFTLSDTQTLTLDGNGLASLSGCRRGLTSLRVTPHVTPPPPATVAPVPATSPWGLAGLGLALAGVAGAAVRRRSH